MEKSLSLKTAIWIYDIEDHFIRWANSAALEYWHADSIEELNERDFEKSTSDAVKQGLLEYKSRFEQGETINEIWQFSPLGIKKQAFCRFSGVMVENGNSKQKLAMLIEATPLDLVSPLIESESTTMLLSLDGEGKLLSSNPPFRSEFGVSLVNFQSLLNEGDTFQAMLSEFSQNERTEKDILLRTQHGMKWFQASVTPALQDNGNIRVLMRLHNIDKRKTTELDLLKQARTDALTGLLNRRGLQEYINPSIQAQQAFHLFYIDLDGFKMINDSLGHEMGDSLLQEVSERLQSIKCDHSAVCRFGGDEFVITVCRALSKAEASLIASNIVDALSSPYTAKKDNFLLISASVGYACFPDHSENLDDVIRFADAAMYASKKLGKKRWTSYELGMDRAILRKSLVAQYLSSAIENEELSLYFQPIMDVKDDTIHSFEALLRWSHPELGHVNPQELISIAEDIGLIDEVENWVIKTAIASLPSLREQTTSQALMAINVSALHIVNPHLTEYLLAQLTANDLKPCDLIIEITESVLLDGIEQNNQAIERITKLGIKLSIDDFGTGYSSLAYLHNINASIVKIDKAFLSQKSGSKVTLSAINDLVCSMDMVTLIEGVETQNNADLCEKIGISLHQGYFYARPKPLRDIQ